MTAPRGTPPRPIRRILRSLLPGGRGDEVVRELDREYVELRERHSRLVAGGWYLVQILRPATWRLAWVLRRIGRREPDDGAHRVRPAHGSGMLRGLSLDLKLAGRMLVKSPGLTVVGVLGIALGVALGVAAFVVFSTTLRPELPLEGGERVVALQHWDVEADEEAPPSIVDFVNWREEMRSVADIAAASMGTQSLITGDGPPRHVRAAEMTASGFDVARVPPLLGRDLAPEDERPGAPEVAVLGYGIWQTSFGSDPGVLGRTILLGGQAHTVVGVMPPGFAFPRNEEIWTALEVDPAGYEQGEGREVFVFGRLSSDATPERAEAELLALGRPAADFLERDAHLRPQVLPYALALEGPRDLTLWEVAQVQMMVILILVAIAANMAILVYARTALRQGEIAVRTALGATRRRIVAQLFLEALALSVVGAALGLGVAHFVVERISVFLEGMEGVPFWVDYGLQPRSAAYALALALGIAVIVGVVPGLQSTGRKLDPHLRRLGSGASVRLGWMWTAMIVGQVAIAVTILPTVLDIGVRELTMVGTRATYPAHEFLSADVSPAVSVRSGMDVEAYRREAAARFRERLPELERRLEADAGVIGVTLEGGLPGRGRLVEVEGIPGPAEGGAHRTGSVGVAPDYFELLGLRMLEGRSLGTADLRRPEGGVVVSEAFVRWILDGSPPVGQRIRFITSRQGERFLDPSPWLEIVGVVEDPQASVLDAEWASPRLFYAVSPEELRLATLLVRVRNGRVNDFAPRFRRIVAESAPELRLGAVGRLSAMGTAPVFAMMTAALIAILASVLLLTAAGIHALMSVAVTRRRAEIGIRRALGSSAGRLLGTVFSRVGWQLASGGVVGSLLGAGLLVGSGRTGSELALFLGGVVLLMLLAGLIAALGPALRGLRIQPAEALREE